MFRRWIGLFGLLVLLLSSSTCAKGSGGPARPLSDDRGRRAIAFTAFKPDASFTPPPIVLQYDPATKTGTNWPDVNHSQWYETTPPMNIGRAATYLREALQKMTGREYPVESKNDLSRGIVLTLLDNASSEIRNDPEIQKALAANASDRYAANEAFYVRSEPNRVLLVANAADGLADAVVELLESVEYEVLGMGPDWIHAPDYRSRTLEFAIQRAGRPSYYIRQLMPMSGQSYGGAGTVVDGLTDPDDEPVTRSYDRWIVGTRMLGKSMPTFPGHALQAYHRDVIAHMRDTGTTEGFLTAKTVIGKDAARPPVSPETKGWLWINAEREGRAANKVFLSDGKEWKPADLGDIGVGLDLSVPFVRDKLLAAMIQQAKAAFEKEQDEPVIFGMEPEDGTGNASIGTQTKYKDWYPKFVAKEKVPFGRPYLLDGHDGLRQPNEIWDPTSASNAIFGTANWLLYQFDAWVDSLPPDQRTTRTGKSKKELIRCSFYSYNFHDIPPTFNPDQRIRVMIADYAKNRGRGKWEKYASHEDMARAFKILLPREPAADYRILSIAQYSDAGMLGVQPTWSTSAKAIAEDYRKSYDAGFRAITAETDFNFGKYGLGYYLISKMLWNARLGSAELDALRDRWFQHAFGGAWKQMKSYYDFMLVENFPRNAPMTWAKAVRMIDDADRMVDGAKEPRAQRRIDDIKQFWYSHYLLNSGRFAREAPEVKEFLWKGQMSYMVAMHGIVRRDFGTSSVRQAAGLESSNGRAHYTRAEVERWWPKVLAQWPLTPVTMFVDTTLVSGKAARSVDLNDLVMVKEFQGRDVESPFLYNSGYMKPAPFAVVARRPGEVIGFKIIWPFIPNAVDYDAKKLAYGVDIWNPAKKAWEPWIDESKTSAPSTSATTSQGKALQLVDVAVNAPRAGTYRFRIGKGGNLSQLASRAYDPVSGQFAGAVGFTFFGEAEGHTQSPAYFYIPKNTKSLDLEAWDVQPVRFVELFKGLPAGNKTPSRKIDIGKIGPHRIALEPGEDGTVAAISGNGFSFPILYSVPTLWAKAPGALMVPRAIAAADGLTILP